MLGRNGCAHQPWLGPAPVRNARCGCTDAGCVLTDKARAGAQFQHALPGDNCKNGLLGGAQVEPEDGIERTSSLQDVLCQSDSKAEHVCALDRNAQPTVSPSIPGNFSATRLRDTWYGFCQACRCYQMYRPVVPERGDQPASALTQARAPTTRDHPMVVSYDKPSAAIVVQKVCLVAKVRAVGESLERWVIGEHLISYRLDSLLLRSCMYSFKMPSSRSYTRIVSNF